MARLSVTHALALRRLAVVGGALGASLAAHCAAAGDLALHHDAALIGRRALVAHGLAALVLAALAAGSRPGSHGR